MQMQMLMAIYGAEFMSSASRHAFWAISLSDFIIYTVMRLTLSLWAALQGALFGKVSITPPVQKMFMPSLNLSGAYDTYKKTFLHN